MIFRQFINDDLGCASYLVGDERAGVAAVVDPRLEVDEYLRVARFMGVSIEHILETHTHADHVSGHGRLTEATGATIHVNRLAGADHPHDPIDDGWELTLGAVTIRALHTPGHRPEHTSFAVIDTSRGGEPWAVLTGDSMFVGSVARPDLAVEPREGAREIFRSLHGSLLGLAPEVEVWPGHLGGSMCGGPGMSMKISSTIGYERANNSLLSEMDEDVRRALAGRHRPPAAQLPGDRRDQPGSPRLPRRPRPPDDTGPGAEPPVGGRAGGGRARRPVVRRRPHPGRDLGDRPAIRLRDAAGVAGGSGREVVLVGRDDDEARHASGLAAAVGVRGGGGYLAGGMSGWRNERRPVERIARITVPELAAMRARDPELQILDVREATEWSAARIPGSVNLPYHALEEAEVGLDLGRPIAVVCGAGHRSAVGASLIQRRGATQALHVVDGGVTLWGQLGHDLEGD